MRVWGATLAAAIAATGCATTGPALAPATPALIVHNRSGGDVSVEARTCGQPDAEPLHRYPVAAGSTGRFEPGPSCFDFVAVRDGAVVGQQGEVTLRHEMEWVIGR